MKLLLRFALGLYVLGGMAACDTQVVAEGGSTQSGTTAEALSTSEIQLAWVDNSSNETGFKIDYATDEKFTQDLVTVQVEANLVAYKLTGLKAATTYYFRVRAFNSAGESQNSPTANATTY